MTRPFFTPTAMACAAGLLSAPAAFAQQAQAGSVVIYGLIDTALRHVNNVDANRGSDNLMDDGIFTGSRLGFRGREELGDGLAAVFTLESGFDPSTGNSLQGTTTADYGQVAANPRFWGREVHAGLRGSAWGVTAGRQYTLAHTTAGRFQPQGNPNNLAYSVFSSHHLARQDNMLRIDGKFGGVELAASRTFGEVAGSDGSDAWALSAGWGTGPVWVGGYAQQMKNVTDTETRKIVGLGGNYKVLSMLTLYAGAMRRTHDVSAQVNKVWTLGANFELTPAITLSAAHLADNQSGSAAFEGSRKVSYVTASYRFSRRTDVYASADHNDVKGGYAKPTFMSTLGTQDGFAVGLRHRF